MENYEIYSHIYFIVFIFKRDCEKKSYFNVYYSHQFNLNIQLGKRKITLFL